MEALHTKEQKAIPLGREVDVTGLISAFRYQFPENFHYDGEQHYGWEFVYTESGSLSVTADQTKYILKSGEMVCHKPMEFHTIRPYRSPACAIIFCFYCTGEKMDYFKNKILAVNKRQKLYLNDIVTNAEVLLRRKKPLDIVRDGAMERNEAGGAINEQFIRNSIELLILSLYSSQSSDVQTRAESYSQFVQRKQLTDNIKKYLRENISGKVYLKDISRRFSYSVASIKNIFKSETGKSVMEYLNDLRIGKAKELLTPGDRLIKDVAFLVGYSNVYYFSNTFKKKTGVSPKNYMRRFKGSEGGALR